MSNALRRIKFPDRIDSRSVPGGNLWNHLLDVLEMMHPINTPTVNHDITPHGVKSHARRVGSGRGAQTVLSFAPTVSGTTINIGPGWWLVDGRHEEEITDESIEITVTGYVIFQASRTNPASWSFINQASGPDMTSATYWEYPIYKVTKNGSTVTVNRHYQTSSIPASGA